MAKIIEASILIKNPPLKVYGYISDPLNMPFWSDMSEVKLVYGSGEVGTIYSFSMPTLMGKKQVSIEITQKVAPIIFAFRYTTTSIDNETSFKISKEGDATRVTTYRKIGIGTVAYLLTLNFIHDRDTKLQMEKMLKRLQSILEK